MRVRRWAVWAGAGVLALIGNQATARTIEVNLLYVHGVKGCQDARLNAENSLADLDAAVEAELPTRIATWQTAHPGDTVVVNSARANLYTATPSLYHPSDS